MMNFRSVAVNTATAFAVTLPFSLLACSESNPTNFDEPVAYSEPAPESSSALESSSSVTDSSELPATPCTAENEGQVETKYYQEGTSMMDTRGYHEYFRCEQGTWIRRGEWVKCGTDGVQVGDLCDLTSHDGVSIRSPYSYSTLYVYVGGGIWNEFKSCDGGSFGECNSVKKH